MGEARRSTEIEYAEDEYEAATGADVLVFMTEGINLARWIWAHRELMKVPRLRLAQYYEPETSGKGLQYVGSRTVGHQSLWCARVTGGAGFMGIHLEAALVAAEPRPIIDDSHGHRENVAEMARLGVYHAGLLITTVSRASGVEVVSTKRHSSVHVHLQAPAPRGGVKATFHCYLLQLGTKRSAVGLCSVNSAYGDQQGAQK